MYSCMYIYLRIFFIEINQELADKASVHDVRACVIRKHYDEVSTYMHKHAQISIYICM
jgi:hypothetical protein